MHKPSERCHGHGPYGSAVSLYRKDRVTDVFARVNRFFRQHVHCPDKSGLPDGEGGLSAYTVVDFGRTERFSWRVVFNGVANPDPATIQDSTRSDFKGIWRVGIAMMLGSVLDSTADAVGPLDVDDDVNPLLRLHVSKDFTLK